jgi:hypothetical protein
MKHTLASLRPEGITLGYKPARITLFQPKIRSY